MKEGGLESHRETGSLDLECPAMSLSSSRGKMFSLYTFLFQEDDFLGFEASIGYVPRFKQIGLNT